MLICPFFLIASGGVTVFLSTQLELIVQKLAFLGGLSSLVLLSLHILPYAIMWVLFSFIYIFMPTPRSIFLPGSSAALWPGRSTSRADHLHQIPGRGGERECHLRKFRGDPVIFDLAAGELEDRAFGTEVSFAHQNVDTYEFEHDCLNVSHAFKRMLSLQIAAILVKRFVAGCRR